jgi:thiol-disulfide isomerase/thioredoxin
MLKMSNLALCLAAGAVTAGIVLSNLYAQQEQAAPPAQPPAQQQEQTAAPAAPGQRTHEHILQELQQASDELQNVITSPEVVMDHEQRTAAAPKVIPPLQRMVKLAEELATTPAGPSFRAEDMAGNFRTMLALFGDKEALTHLEKQATSPNAEEALAAKLSLNVIRWIDRQDVEVQTRVLDDMETLAKEHSESNELTMVLFQFSQEGAANRDLARRAESIIAGMSSEPAQQMKEFFAGEAQMRELEGKPLTLQGPTVDGKPFSTDQLKGKVVLVDHWATWCGPCLADLPRLKQTYAKYRDQGLEIVGISWDEQASDLQQFLKRNPEMTWPQLFDSSKPGRHALSEQYGVNAIPRYWLIDRKGIVRSINARTDYEKQIEKLLAEPAE